MARKEDKVQTKEGKETKEAETRREMKVPYPEEVVPWYNHMKTLRRYTTYSTM